MIIKRVEAGDRVVEIDLWPDGEYCVAVKQEDRGCPYPWEVGPDGYRTIQWYPFQALERAEAEFNKLLLDLA